MPEAKTYNWTVLLHQPIQGFAKTRRVIAGTIEQAMEEARRGLRERGYDDRLFEVTEAKRGRPCD